MQKNFKVEYKNELAILGLVNKYFWKSKIGPIISILLPLVFMIIFKLVNENDQNFFASGLSSYFAFSILPLLLITFPQLIVEFKISIILRKISVSSISATKFCLIVLFYYLLMVIASNIIVIILYAAFLNKDAKYFFEIINWGQLIYSLLNIYLTTLTFGLLLGILMKKNSIVQVVGFAIMIISILFAGEFIPMTVIARSDALRYISLFSPITYSLGLMNNVLMINNTNFFMMLPIDPSLVPLRNELLSQCYPNNIFDLNHPFVLFDYTFNQENLLIPRTNFVIYEIWQKALNLVMPYVCSGLFLFISIKKFNWTSR